MDTYITQDGKKFTKEDPIVLNLNTQAKQYGLYHIDIYLVLITQKTYSGHEMEEVARKYAIVNKDKFEVLHICSVISSVVLYLDLLKALQDGLGQPDR